MAFFDTFFTPTDENASASLYALLKRLRVKVTRATVRESLEQHPDFPSLLSLSDVLNDWQVESMGLQLNTVEQLRELTLPFIAHLRKNNGWYVLVTALQGDTITYTDNEQGRRAESLTDFEKNWSGVVLLAEYRPAEFDPAEKNQQAGEVDYAEKHKLELLENLRGPFVLAG
ncbi:cysteine peptidase family C39 domain-containing protein [Spirosoma linguale]|uniref:Peptidase C39 bacteriocin processing n=1 Tax=Spirosoma linguale (strain ATCC 33905 / DSM 74 / LMG 10896 / Claus 1) TaxID=504472 RepID=D2QH70_SPILD|nr:peptidase C39 bacteriocin processing [Spirosoma linguale DSM 74]